MILLLKSKEWYSKKRSKYIDGGQSKEHLFKYGARILTEGRAKNEIVNTEQTCRQQIELQRMICKKSSKQQEEQAWYCKYRAIILTGGRARILYWIQSKHTNNTKSKKYFIEYRANILTAGRATNVIFNTEQTY